MATSQTVFDEAMWRPSGLRDSKDCPGWGRGPDVPNVAGGVVVIHAPGDGVRFGRRSLPYGYGCGL